MRNYFIILILTSFLFACNDDGAGTDNCESSVMMPLNPGNYWIYQRSAAGRDVMDSAVVKEIKTLNGRQAAIIKVYRNKELQETWPISADDSTILLYSWALAPVFRSGCDTTLSDWRCLIRCENEWTSEFSGQKTVHLLHEGKIVEAEVTSEVSVRCKYSGNDEIALAEKTIKCKCYDYHMEMKHTLAPESDYLFENGSKTRSLNPVDASLWLNEETGIIKTDQENNERLLLRYFVQ